MFGVSGRYHQVRDGFINYLTVLASISAGSLNMEYGELISVFYKRRKYFG